MGDPLKGITLMERVDWVMEGAAAYKRDEMSVPQPAVGMGLAGAGGED